MVGERYLFSKAMALYRARLEIDCEAEYSLPVLVECDWSLNVSHPFSSNHLLRWTTNRKGPAPWSDMIIKVVIEI